jgi:hypothetical protein
MRSFIGVTLVKRGGSKDASGTHVPCIALSLQMSLDSVVSSFGRRYAVVLCGPLLAVLISSTLRQPEPQLK